MELIANLALVTHFCRKLDADLLILNSIEGILLLQKNFKMLHDA